MQSSDQHDNIVINDNKPKNRHKKGKSMDIDD